MALGLLALGQFVNRHDLRRGQRQFLAAVRDKLMGFIPVFPGIRRADNLPGGFPDIRDHLLLPVLGVPEHPVNLNARVAEPGEIGDGGEKVKSPVAFSRGALDLAGVFALHGLCPLNGPGKFTLCQILASGGDGVLNGSHSLPYRVKFSQRHIGKALVPERNHLVKVALKAGCLISQQRRVHYHITVRRGHDLLVCLPQVHKGSSALHRISAAALGPLSSFRVNGVSALQIDCIQKGSHWFPERFRDIALVGGGQQLLGDGPDVPLDFVADFPGGAALTAGGLLGGILLLQGLDLLGPFGPLTLDGVLDLLAALLPQLGNPLLIGSAQGRDALTVLLPDACYVLPVGFSQFRNTTVPGRPGSLHAGLLAVSKGGLLLGNIKVGLQDLACHKPGRHFHI